MSPTKQETPSWAYDRRPDDVCDHCLGTVVVDEPPRPVTREEARGHYDEISRILVANATCSDCHAKYLAWVGNVNVWRDEGVQFLQPRPNVDNFPEFHIVRHVVLTRTHYTEPKPADTQERAWLVETNDSTEDTTGQDKGANTKLDRIAVIREYFNRDPTKIRKGVVSLVWSIIRTFNQP